MSHQPHPQRPADLCDGVIAGLCIRPERSVQGFAGQAGRLGNFAHAARPGDVSFELRRGECLGLIGPNGAGKSTLRKMLNGLIKPDQGRITMRGQCAGCTGAA